MLDIRGMVDVKDASRVHRALARRPGVMNVFVHLRRGWAAVTHDPARVDADALVDVVRDAASADHRFDAALQPPSSPNAPFPARVAFETAEAS